MVKNLIRKPWTKSPGYNSKKKNFMNLVLRIPRWKIWAENLQPKVLATIFKKKCHPRMGIFQLPPSKCPCKDFSISLFLHPNNLCWRKRVKFFLILKFRVYKSVSFLSHSVSMIMSRHFYRVIFSSLIIGIIGAYWHGIKDLGLLVIIYKNWPGISDIVFLTRK